MEQLQGLDSLFIHHETAHAPLHVLAVMQVSRNDARHPVNAQTYRTIISARIADFPGLCKKLVDPPIKLAPPLWVRAKPDLRLHVIEKTLGENGTPVDINSYLAKIDSIALDRSRPLWEFHIIHEQNSDISFLIAKAHHALLDGMAGFEIIANIFDADEHGADKDLEKDGVTLDISDEAPDWTTHIGATLLTQPVTLAQTSLKVARNIVNFAKSTLDSDEQSHSPFPWTAPAWPEHRTLSSKRVLADTSLDKQTIKNLRKAHSISFHDAIGVIIAGALRNVLLDAGDLPDLPLVCCSPVSTRRKKSIDGNELSVMFAQLPTHIEDPIERISFMRESFSTAKDFLAALGADTLGELSLLAPWSALGALWNLYSDSGLSDKHSPFANIMLSTLPGPNFPLYCGGAKVEYAYPIGPIFDGTLLNITAISYLNKVNCGIVSEPNAFSGVDLLGKEMLKEVQLLSNL